MEGIELMSIIGGFRRDFLRKFDKGSGCVVGKFILEFLIGVFVVGGNVREFCWGYKV